MEGRRQSINSHRKQFFISGCFLYRKHRVILQAHAGVLLYWMPPSLSELTPIIYNTELTHLGSEAYYSYALLSNHL